MRHEAEVMNQRLTWLGTFHGFLFAALAFAWSKPDTKAIVYILCALAISISISIGIATLRANKSVNKLCERWDNQKPDIDIRLDVEGVRGKSGYLWWLMPGYAVPWMFCLAWLGVLIVSICKN